MHIGVLSRRTVAQVVAAGLLIVGVGIMTTGIATASAPEVTVNNPVPSIGIMPDSANGCSGAICIFVTGSGLHVSDWQTSVALSKSMCSTASFLVNGVLWASGVNTCGSAGDLLVSDWESPGNFANGTVLCNTWSGISGKPCETVHG
jgi:hypothetical protein